MSFNYVYEKLQNVLESIDIFVGNENFKFVSWEKSSSPSFTTKVHFVSRKGSLKNVQIRLMKWVESNKMQILSLYSCVYIISFCLGIIMFPVKSVLYLKHCNLQNDRYCIHYLPSSYMKKTSPQYNVFKMYSRYYCTTEFIGGIWWNDTYCTIYFLYYPVCIHTW